MTLVDTNVLLDVAVNDAAWAEWSKTQIERAGERGPVVINPVVYAEISVFYRRTEEVDDLLSQSGVTLREIPLQALFLAGKAFQAYKRHGGIRTGVLPDFFIGAHANAAGVSLLTRDAKRYRTYFPDVPLITPHQ